EAEREYVTRAGTTTMYWFGSAISQSQASYDGLEDPRHGTFRVESFAPNPWGVYQMHGNIWEWVEDCRHENYGVAPRDGSAWITGDCQQRVLRGGSFMSTAGRLRSAERMFANHDHTGGATGFRVARTLAR